MFFVGEERVFACTGIFMDFDGSTSTSTVLTSASLVRASADEYKIADDLKVGTANNYVLLLFVHL